MGKDASILKSQMQPNTKRVIKTINCSKSYISVMFHAYLVYNFKQMILMIWRRLRSSGKGQGGDYHQFLSNCYSEQNFTLENIFSTAS